MEKVHPLFSRIDRSFDESMTAGYSLVLQVTGRSAAYSVFDHGEDRYIALESYDIPLSGLVNQEEWLKNPFRSVYVIIENNRNTLIPEEFFEESEKETYLNFAMGSVEDENIGYDRLGMIEAINIFGIRNSLDDDIHRIFTGMKVCHLSSFLIESIWMRFKNLIAEKRIFIFVRQDDFNLLIFDRKHLIYSNAFHFMAPEDVVYFVIFVMEQLNLNPEEVPVTLLGNIENGSPHFEMLFRYIRNIDFASRNEDLRYSPVFEDVPDHAWYSLLNPAMCGS